MNIFHKIFLFLFFVSVPVFSYSKVVVIHGLSGLDLSWNKFGNDFINSLKSKADKIGQTVDIFTWDQNSVGVTYIEKINAGKQLAKKIINYIKDGEKEIILIGHGTGIHIINIASQLLGTSHDNLMFYDKEIKLVKLSNVVGINFVREENIEEELLEEIVSENKIENESERGTSLKKLTITDKNRISALVFEDAKREIADYKEKQLFGIARTKDFLIDRVYRLGKVSISENYVTNMDLIGSFFNIYSPDQNFVGDQLLFEPENERAVDLRIKMKEVGCCGLCQPINFEVDAKLIGEWILEIPNSLMQDKIGGFEKFTFEKKGIVVFSKDKLPAYKIDVSDDDKDDISGLYWLLDKLNIFQSFC